MPNIKGKILTVKVHMFQSLLSTTLQLRLYKDTCCKCTSWWHKYVTPVDAIDYSTVSGSLTDETQVKGIYWCNKSYSNNLVSWMGHWVSTIKEVKRQQQVQIIMLCIFLMCLQLHLNNAIFSKISNSPYIH